ncbi:hypothetical protein, partial [Shewanella colwelliana]|uniref:hypothetical protein n=1 Tax=Shewanella colwelliana TaxID=23 RepID=UPI001C7DC0C9
FVFIQRLTYFSGWVYAHFSIIFSCLMGMPQIRLVTFVGCLLRLCLFLLRILAINTMPIVPTKPDGFA